MNRHLVVWPSVFFVHSIVVAAVVPLPDQARSINTLPSPLSFGLTYQTHLQAPVNEQRLHFGNDREKSNRRVDAFYPPITIYPRTSGWVAALYPPVTVDPRDSDSQRVDATGLRRGPASILNRETAPAGLIFRQRRRQIPAVATAVPHASLVVDVTPRLAPVQLRVRAVAGGVQPATLEPAGFTFDMADRTPNATAAAGGQPVNIETAGSVLDLARLMQNATASAGEQPTELETADFAFNVAQLTPNATAAAAAQPAQLETAGFAFDLARLTPNPTATAAAQPAELETAGFAFDLARLTPNATAAAGAQPAELETAGFAFNVAQFTPNATATAGAPPAELKTAGFAFDLAQLTPNTDALPAPPQPLPAPPAAPQTQNAPPTAPRPQPIPAAATRTKYVWRPREAIDELIPGFRLGRWEGRLEAYLDDSDIKTRNPNSQQRNENRIYDTRITLRNRGAYVIDPRLLRLTLGGTVGIVKQKYDFTSADTVLKDRDDGDILGYDFLAEILPRNSFSVDLFANRDRRTESGTLAGPLLTDISNAGISVKARRLYIPSTLYIRTDRAKNESGTANLVTSRRDERRNSITYDGRRGWLNRALRMRYRFVDKSDKFSPGNDFRNHSGTVFYSLDFGPNLRKRWDSNIRVFDQTGIIDEQRLDIDQLLHIDHTDRLRTQYRYVGAFTERPEGDNDINTLSFVLDHELYESLNTTLELNGSRDNFPGGRRDLRRSRLNFDYDKQLPNAKLTANLTLFRESQDDEFETSQAFVSQEPHRFDDTFALPISLNQPFIELDSVRIIKTRNGPDVPGCGSFSVPRPLLEGVDYTLRTVGALTEIVPLPCSLATPGINPADAITVDYRFTVDPSVVIDSKGYALRFSVDDGHFRPYYRREKTDQDSASGFDSGILNDRDAEAFGIDVRYDTDNIRLQFRVESESFTSRDQDYDATSAFQSIRYNFSQQWQFSLNGRVSERRFSQPQDRLSELWGLRAVLTYARDANLRIELFAEARDLQDTLTPDEHHEEIGVRAHWRLGKLDVRPTLRFIDRRRGMTDLQDRRATLRLIRRF